MPNKVALVTGGTSGIGLAAAQALAQAGCTVYTLSRRSADKPRHIAADVTDEAAAQAAVEQVVQAEGRLDVLVNCAGFGISGAGEFTKTADAKKQLEVNLFGTVNLIRAVVPVMRRQGGGRIVSTSSVAAVVPIPFQVWYTISKSAINMYTQAMANELRPFGITLCAVMPGDTKTGFTAAREKEPEGDAVYHGVISRSVAKMEHDELAGAPPEAVAKVICRAALRRHVKPLYTVGLSYKLVIFIMKVLPARASNYLVGKLYAQ